VGEDLEEAKVKGLAGKSVMITGAAAGIGRATAQRFYDEGATLCLIDLAPLENTGLKEAFPERMTYFQADVTNANDVQKLEQWANDNHLHALVNNAGITRDASLLKMSMEDWDKVIAVNLTAVFTMSQMAARVMKAHGNGGAIMSAASVVAHYGNFGQANYVATKAGVIGMMKTLAKELGRYQIRANAVAPGFIGTDMVAKIPDKVLVMMKEKTPLGRIGKPEEIAAMYAFLASDDGAYVSGAVMNVDGGLVIG